MNLQIDKLIRDDELLLLKLYEQYVQQLYNYGMHACGDHALVRNALVGLFDCFRNERQLCISNNAIRFFLFKKLRELIICTCDGLGNSFEIFAITSSPREKQPIDGQLSPWQREAVFLKLNCSFGYHEVAAIMNINPGSVYNFISDALEIARQNLEQHASETNSLGKARSSWIGLKAMLGFKQKIYN